MYRPSGVIAIAIILIILAGVMIFGAIDMWTIVVPGSQREVDMFNLFNIYLVSQGIQPIILVGFSSPLQNLMNNVSYYTTLGGLTVVLAVLYILGAIGLIKMKRWGYTVALMMGIITLIGGIVFTLIGLFTYIMLLGIFILISGIAILVYLGGDVKYEFE